MTWQDTTHQFNEQAAQCDNWYQDNPVFDIELAALVAIQKSLPRPALEIGVGPGHFAKALQIEFGIGPAISPLHLAARRSIIPINSVGDFLPVRSGSIGTVYILESWSTLLQPPNESPRNEKPLPCSREDAEFNVLVTCKKGENL